MKEAIENYKSEKVRKKALNIVKYQNFKSTFALQKSEVPIGRAVFDAGVAYIKNGTITSPLSKVLKAAIDQLRAECVQPLTPPESERRHFRQPYATREAHPPVVDVVPKQVASRFEYGVRIGNTVRILESENDARLFIQGVQFTGAQAHLVEVEMHEIK